MSQNKKKHQAVSAAWAYRLKNGTFYKKGNRGSFSLSNKPYSKREITTGSLHQATFFSNPMNSEPYAESFMIGGKWIKVTTTSIHEWE